MANVKIASKNNTPIGTQRHQYNGSRVFWVTCQIAMKPWALNSILVMIAFMVANSLVILHFKTN